MHDIGLGPVETRFAQIIWQHAPLPSSALVAHAQQQLGWKKSTTYTVLKRLCEKGLFENRNGTVQVLICQEEFYARQSQRFVEETFQGSLPAFLTAFTKGKGLTRREVAELRKMIASYEEE